MNSQPIKVSNRRLNSEGTGVVLIKYILCSLFLVVRRRGPKRGFAEKLLKYDMGSGIYKKRGKLFEKILKKIKEITEV